MHSISNRPMKAWCFAVPLLLSIAACTEPIPQISAREQVIQLEQHPVCLATIPAKGILLGCAPQNKLVYWSKAKNTITQSLDVELMPTKLLWDARQDVFVGLHTGQNVISIMTPRPLSVTQRIDSGAIVPVCAKVHPQKNELWISDGISAVWVLTWPSMQLKKKIPVGRYPKQIVFNPRSTEVYVCLQGENQVGVIDSDTYELQANIPVGVYPRTLLIQENQLYVANFGEDSVSIIDLSDRKEISRVKVCQEPETLVFLTKTLLVSGNVSRKIVAVDVNKGKVIGQIRVASFPENMVKFDEQTLIVTMSGKKNVVMITPQIKAD